MTDDIVERLRAWARDLQTGRDCFGADQDLKEAADEIERLRAQNDALREARDECLAVIDFAMKVEDYNERDAFLRGWNEGDTSEWPEFRATLEEK